MQIEIAEKLEENENYYYDTSYTCTHTSYIAIRSVGLIQ